MKLAVLADIHGNSWALEAVLEDVRSRSVDGFINLGDIMYGPLKPGDTYEMLRDLNATTIQGNQDRELWQATAVDLRENSTLAYVTNNLGPEPLRWLQSLPATQLLFGEIFACHGTPTNDTVYLLEDVSRGFAIMKEEQAIADLLDDVRSPVVLCGHSHIPRVVRFSTGTIVLNPGSVGLPAYDDNLPNYHTMETYSPFASYAVIERKNGNWFTELVKVPYDFSSAADQARALGRNDWSVWLTTGRATF